MRRVALAMIALAHGCGRLEFSLRDDAADDDGRTDTLGDGPGVVIVHHAPVTCAD